MTEGLILRLDLTRPGDSALLAHSRLVGVEGVVHPLPSGRWRATGCVVLGSTYRKGDSDQNAVPVADAEFESATQGEAEGWLMDWCHRTAQKITLAALRAVYVDPNGSRG